MAEEFDLNNQSRGSDAVAQIPTSASEISIRTMASDIQMMGQGGGMVSAMPQAAPAAPPMPAAPAASDLAIPATAHLPQTGGAGISAPGTILPQEPAPSSGKGKVILITVVVIIAVLGLFALGYFVL